jgi:hypothetical protein
MPGLQEAGTFEPFLNIQDLLVQQPSPTTILGQRRCPNPECQAHLFFTFQNNKLLVSYPPELIDFDPVDLPQPVLKSFEEAISCHLTSYFIAAAMMVRKTLPSVTYNR